MIIDFPVKILLFAELQAAWRRRGKERKKIIWRVSVSLAVFLAFIIASIPKNIFRYLVDKKSAFQVERYFSEQSPSLMIGKLTAD